MSPTHAVAAPEVVDLDASRREDQLLHGGRARATAPDALVAGHRSCEARRVVVRVDARTPCRSSARRASRTRSLGPRCCTPRPHPRPGSGTTRSAAPGHRRSSNSRSRGEPEWRPPRRSSEAKACSWRLGTHLGQCLACASALRPTARTMAKPGSSNPHTLLVSWEPRARTPRILGSPRGRPGPPLPESDKLCSVMKPLRVAARFMGGVHRVRGCRSKPAGVAGFRGPSDATIRACPIASSRG